MCVCMLEILFIFSIFGFYFTAPPKKIPKSHPNIAHFFLLIFDTNLFDHIYHTRAIRTPAFYKNMRVSSGVIFEKNLNLWRSNLVFAQKVDFCDKKVAFYSNFPKVAL